MLFYLGEKHQVLLMSREEWYEGASFGKKGINNIEENK